MDKVGEYDKYDTLWIGAANAPDQTVMGIGVQAQFWFTGGDDRATRMTVLDAIGDYIAMFPDESPEYVKSGSNRASPLRGDNWRQYYEGLIQKLAPKEEVFSPTVHDNDYINHHFTWGFCRPPRDDIDDTLSYWAASVRPSWVKDNTADYVAAVVRWAATIKPAHGTCGLAPIFEIGMDRNYAAEYWPFLARFPCLDFFTAMDLCAGASDGVRTVNWLTILSDVYVEKLGGIEAITARLHALSTMHPYDGGIVVQACPEPQIGDVSLANYPAPYVAINDIVRPVRFEAYPERPTCLIKVPAPLDALEETVDWVMRFDDKGQG